MNKDDTVAIIRSLLSSTNSSYTIYSLNRDFKNETGMNIPLFGYNSIADFLISIPETLKVTGIYPIQRVSLVTNQKSAHIVSLVKRQKSAGSKKKCFSKNKFNIEKAALNSSFRSEDFQPSQVVSEKNDFGDFEERNGECFGDKFLSNIKETSPTNLDLTLSSNPYKVVNYQTQQQVIFTRLTHSQLLYRKTAVLQFFKITLVLFLSNYNRMTFDLINERLFLHYYNQRRDQRLIPLKYFFCTEGTIPSISVELYARVGEYVEICPCYILSPHKFYFHFRKLKKKFSNFFEKFQKFYSMYEIPNFKKELIRPKQVCAVFHKVYAEAEWHRVEINKIISNSRVIVNFIDCGIMVQMSTEKLKFLHRNFTSFPRQAVLGFLANIRPLKGGSKWSLCAIKKFYDLAFQKALIAGVVEMDPETCCMKVALSCTKNSEIHINDTLVKEGFAEFDVDVWDTHFADISKSRNLRSKTIRDFNSYEPVSETMNSNETLAKNYIKSVQDNTSSVTGTPIYFPNNYNSNNRLKKMFSFIKEK